MSAVDVLAVMDADATHADAYRIVYGVIDATPQEMAAGSAEARAAVAELIESGDALQRAMDDPEKGPFDSLTVKRFHEADARHRAAPARCKGGACD